MQKKKKDANKVNKKLVPNKTKSHGNNMSKEKLLNTIEAAEYLGLKSKQLDNFKSLKIGPHFIKQGNRCFYSKQDLDRWLEARMNVKRKKMTPRSAASESNKPIKSATKQAVKKAVAKRNETEIQAETRTRIITKDKTQAAIHKIEALIGTKKGFFDNKTDVAIFENIASVLSFLIKDIEKIKKKTK